MRHLGGYTWEILLNEYFSITQASMELLHEEKQQEKRAYEEAKRKGKRR